MGSTNIPRNKTKMARIQCETPEDGILHFDIETTRFQELLTTVVDCNYKRAGCIVNDYMKEIKKHEERCSYRQMSCPVYDNICGNFMAKNFEDHMTKNHRSECLLTKENYFFVSIDVGKDIKLTRMVTIGEDVIFCRVESVKQKLYTFLYLIRNTNPVFNCKVTIMADNVTWGKQKIQITNADLGFYENNKPVAIFDLDKLIKAKDIFSQISLVVECKMVENIYCTKVLENFLCITCGDFLTQDYYQCGSRHMHCKPCKDLGQTSCFNFGSVLKTSIAAFTFSCPHKSFGCKQYIPRHKSNHELVCPFKKFHCASSSCSFIVDRYLDFISHLQENHSNSIINTNVCFLTDLTPKSWYMFAFGSVFLCKVYDKHCCAIEWIWTSVLEQKFSFEVNFGSDYGKSITLKTQTDPPGVSYKPNSYKSIYNSIKKQAEFKLYESVVTVTKITFKVFKETDQFGATVQVGLPIITPSPFQQIMLTEVQKDTPSLFGTPVTSAAFGTPNTSAVFGTPKTSSAFGSSFFLYG